MQGSGGISVKQQEKERRLREIRRLLSAGDNQKAKQYLDDWYPLLDEQARQSYGWQLDELYGTCAALQADMGSAARAYWQAVQHDCYLRSQLEHFSSYLFCLHYLPGIDHAALAAQYALYGRMLAGTPQLPLRPWLHAAHRRIRVGYLSTNFRQHAAADFFLPLFEAADHQRYEVYAYALGDEDAATKRFQQAADHWRELDPLAMEDNAQQIYEDAIDILIDLSGHSDGGLTLLIMAHKPAPVQVSAIGWVDTTGLPGMDCFLTDSCCALPGEDRCFSERLLRLSRPHLCYQPLRLMPPQTSWTGDHPIVFGSFNNFAKISDEMLHIWKTLLEHVPGSHLELRDTAAFPSRQQALQERADRLGFSAQQLSLHGAADGYLSAYNGIDIALDTSPYPGGATTCEALYMGVPVITMAGERHGSRLGASLLKSLGLVECIAVDADSYIKKAAALSADKERLKTLHGMLRCQMEQSRLMDGADYMRCVEAGYEEIWRGWCQTNA